MSYPRPKPASRQAVLRRLMRLVRSYPDTPLRRFPQKDRALVRRRAKNKRARASRKANR